MEEERGRRESEKFSECVLRGLVSGEKFHECGANRSGGVTRLESLRKHNPVPTPAHHSHPHTAPLAASASSRSHRHTPICTFSTLLALEAQGSR